MAHNEAVDVVLVGAGIMSATLAVLLKELDPAIKLEVVELMDSGAAESSNPVSYTHLTLPTTPYV